MAVEACGKGTATSGASKSPNSSSSSFSSAGCGPASGALLSSDGNGKSRDDPSSSRADDSGTIAGVSFRLNPPNGSEVVASSITPLAGTSGASKSPNSSSSSFLCAGGGPATGALLSSDVNGKS